MEKTLFQIFYVLKQWSIHLQKERIIETLQKASTWKSCACEVTVAVVCLKILNIAMFY